jgi:peptide/nickel transport system substrate-binding protein
MSQEERFAAAKTAALGYLAAAGYKVENGKVLSAPEGASMSYTWTVAGDGGDNHRDILLITNAINAFSDTGFSLAIDNTNGSIWSQKISGAQFDIISAGWSSTIDPDIYQIYSGPNAVGYGGGDSNHYQIRDTQLDELMLETRKSPDNAYRKQLFKQCFDIILDWAVEVPTVQRQNAIIFSSERIDTESLPKDITTFFGWAAEIQNLKMKA